MRYLPAFSRLVRGALAGGLFAIASTGAVAQLTTRSPFLPPQGSAPVAAQQNQPLEFRAFLDTGEGMLYRIYDPAKKAGTWAKVNEPDPSFGVVVKQYDAERKVLLVEHEGRTLTLPEREAKIVSSGAMAQVMPAPMPMPQAPQNFAQAGVINATPADEQRRLEAVAQEVARRRALREQASQQMNGNQPPQTVTVPGIPRPPAPVQR